MGEPNEHRPVYEATADLEDPSTAQDVYRARNDSNMFRGMVVQRLDLLTDEMRKNTRATLLLVQQLRGESAPAAAPSE